MDESKDKDQLQDIALLFCSQWKNDQTAKFDIMTVLIIIEIFYNTMMIYKECKKKPPAMVADATFLSRASKYNPFAYLLRRKLRAVIAKFAEPKDQAELEEKIPHFVFDNKDTFIKATSKMSGFSPDANS